MMHVVLGDGEMTKRDLSSNLEDLLESAGDDPFWFLVQAKAEPTATDEALMGWLVEREVYFEVIGDDLKGADKIYAKAQDRHEVKRLGAKVVSLMQEKPDEDEDEEADLLALFVSNDSDAEEDRWLNEVVQLVIEAGFTVKALNGGLTEVGLEEGEEAAEEPEPAPTPAKKAPAKKAAAKPAPEPEEGGEVDITTYNRELLEEMDLDQLKAVASELGITVPPRSRRPTYVDYILDEAEDVPEAEVAEVAEVADLEPSMISVEPSTNGDETLPSTVDELADALVAAVIRRLVNLLETTV